MLPNQKLLVESEQEQEARIVLESEPNYTFCIDWENKRVLGYCDGLEAVKQAVWKILNVERYRHVIYGWEQGIELEDLVGKSISYVATELKSRIQDALLQDDRIQEVSNFKVWKEKHKLRVQFEVKSTEGIVQAEKEVEVF